MTRSTLIAPLLLALLLSGCAGTVPTQPADPKVDEFICFVLSREGQQIVAESDIYFALSPPMVREQLAKLD